MWNSAAKHNTLIDVKDYQRLHDVERHIWYSPVGIGLALIGLAAAGYTFWGLSRGFIFLPEQLIVGYAVFLAAYGALFVYYFGYRFRNVKCPGCSELMQAYVADVQEGGWRNFIQAIEIRGRYYRRPHDEDDSRPWIRLMKMVRACRRCKKFVDCSRMHYETCTGEELEQIRQRVGAS